MSLTALAAAQAQEVMMNPDGTEIEPGTMMLNQDILPKPAAPPAQMPPGDMPAMNMPGMDMPGMDMTMPMNMKMPMPMKGRFGPYAMARESSGTSWQPESTPHQGWDFMAGDWMLMAHGDVYGIYDNQGGPRGGDKTYSASMAMLMAQRPVGDSGTLGLRGMVSLDPLMGRSGYPLLFATGETANGRDALVDRQHPHDLFMELSASYSEALSDVSSAFLYLGMPGEPALGPPAFMHRFSGADNPEAPLTHHWMDSTHITYGVATAGYVYESWKIEGSLFKGREPDQYRYGFDSPKFDSVATRLTFNPNPDWSFQTSWGYLKSPEQLEPSVNENRLTASSTYNLPLGNSNWATTFAWGRKYNHPGQSLDGFLIESEFTVDDTHTLFARAERVDENELFEAPSPLAGRAVTVGKISAGYIYDLPVAEHLKMGIGGLVSRYDYPAALNSAYGKEPTSFMVFVRLKLK